MSDIIREAMLVLEAAQLVDSGDWHKTFDILDNHFSPLRTTVESQKAEIEEILEENKSIVEQSNLCMDVVISKIKELFPERSLMSPDPMESAPVALIVLCKSQKFANDKYRKPEGESK